MRFTMFRVVDSEDNTLSEKPFMDCAIGLHWAEQEAQVFRDNGFKAFIREDEFVIED